MKWLKHVTTPLALLGGLVLIILCTPLVLWWSNWLSGDWPLDLANDPAKDQSEILIVLAGGALDQGILGDNTYGRCVYTILAYRERKYKTIVLSGGSTGGPPVSILMRDFLVSHGIPQEVMVLETQSRSTYENALAVKPIVEKLAGRKVLLSSDIHMYRALRVFRKAGIEVSPRPFPEGLKRGSRWRGRLPVFFDLVDETTKILYYRWQGWI